MKIHELMTVQVRTVRATDSLSAAAQAMWEGDVGCLPVLDAESKVVGMITDRDLTMASHLRGAPLWALSVADTMAKVVYSAKPNDKLRQAAHLMETHKLRRIPILDDAGKLVGLLTLSDLARAAANKDSSLSAKDVNAVLAKITAQRDTAPTTQRMVVEVHRQTAPKAESANVLQPAPRPAKPAAPAPAARKRGKRKLAK